MKIALFLFTILFATSSLANQQCRNLFHWYLISSRYDDDLIRDLLPKMMVSTNFTIADRSHYAGYLPISLHRFEKLIIKQKQVGPRSQVSDRIYVENGKEPNLFEIAAGAARRQAQVESFVEAFRQPGLSQYITGFEGESFAWALDEAVYLYRFLETQFAVQGIQPDNEFARYRPLMRLLFEEPAPDGQHAKSILKCEFNRNTHQDHCVLPETVNLNFLNHREGVTTLRRAFAWASQERGLILVLNNQTLETTARGRRQVEKFPGLRESGPQLYAWLQSGPFHNLDPKNIARIIPLGPREADFVSALREKYKDSVRDQPQ